VQVTASNSTGWTTQASAQTAVVALAPPVDTAPPSIHGLAQNRSALSADPGTWVGTQPISYAYQWRRCASYSSAVTADAPVGYWRLGEASGSSAADASGNGNVGSYVSGVQLGAAGAVAGDTDTAAGFDGVAGRMSVPDKAALRLNGSFSIEFWAKLRAAANSFPGILRKGDGSSGGSGWFIYYNTTNLRLNFQRAGVDGRLTSSAGALSASAYKHYVLSYDASSSTLRWYVNGALDSTYTGVSFPASTDTSTLDLGVGHDFGNEFLDDVAVYSSALSATRVSAHYTAGTLGCSDIAGATGSTYTLTSADIGRLVSARVTASNAAGSAAMTSAPTDAVQAGDPGETTPPSISGTLRNGQTLSAGNGAWTGTQPIAFSYQWQRCDPTGANCVDIAGATGQTYTLTAADVGSTMQVEVTGSNSVGSETDTAETGVVEVAGGDPIFAGAGDIADVAGGSTGDAATANVLSAIVTLNPGRTTIFTAGDNAYENGTQTEFNNNFDPTWGRFKSLIKPAVGNHDYQTSGAAGYYNYFGAAAGDPTKGYYAYNLGSWRIYALNSELEHGSGFPGDGAVEEQWLANDLAANAATKCVLAYWHEPRFSSGGDEDGQASDTAVQPFWQTLYNAGADLVITGHNHNYQRFAPLDGNGAVDLAHGMREFVVGTGGKSHYNFLAPMASTEAYNYDTFGILQLTLHTTSYDFRFLPEAGKTFTDSGSGVPCH
jgi:hypothetical protein